jgi:hypothetical protein
MSQSRRTLRTIRGSSEDKSVSEPTIRRRYKRMSAQLAQSFFETFCVLYVRFCGHYFFRVRAAFFADRDREAFERFFAAA